MKLLRNLMRKFKTLVLIMAISIAVTDQVKEIIIVIISLIVIWFRRLRCQAPSVNYYFCHSGIKT